LAFFWGREDHKPCGVYGYEPYVVHRAAEAGPFNTREEATKILAKILAI
jgi:hypothetical protein